LADLCQIGHSALFWLNYFIVTDFQIQPKKLGEYKVTPYVSLNKKIWYLDKNGHFIALSMRHIS
jgi:hypothetical protein